MPKPPPGNLQEPPDVGDSQKHLGHRQGDELGVADERWAPPPAPARQEIVDTHVKCGDEGVNVGVHEASMVDVAFATPPFGALTTSPPTNSESTI